MLRSPPDPHVRIELKHQRFPDMGCHRSSNAPSVDLHDLGSSCRYVTQRRPNKLCSCGLILRATASPWLARKPSGGRMKANDRHLSSPFPSSAVNSASRGDGRRSWPVHAFIHMPTVELSSSKLASFTGMGSCSGNSRSSAMSDRPLIVQSRETSMKLNIGDFAFITPGSTRYSPQQYSQKSRSCIASIVIIMVSDALHSC